MVEDIYENWEKFNFNKVSDSYCQGFQRLYHPNDYLNNTCLLGGDNIKNILCLMSSDNGLTGTKLYKGSNFQKLLCSNIVFLEFNHDIISSYRAIGFISKNNPNIKFNRKIFGSLQKDWRKTRNDQINKYIKL